MSNLVTRAARSRGRLWRFALIAACLVILLFAETMAAISQLKKLNL